MEQTLRGMRARRADDDRGFTLIELLVVVVIIGVLVAIAIPMYLNYRKGAENKSAESDVRGAISAIEQFYTENANQYPSNADNSSAGTTGGGQIVLTLTGGSGVTPQTINVSSGNTLFYYRVDAAAGVVLHYYICAESNDGGGVYVYNSLTGGSVAKATKDMATCKSTGA